MLLKLHFLRTSLSHNNNIIDHPPDLEVMGDVHVSSRCQHIPRSNPKSNSKGASASPVAATWQISPPPPPPTQHSAHRKYKAQRSQISTKLHAEIYTCCIISLLEKTCEANSPSAHKKHCRRCQFLFGGGGSRTKLRADD